MGYVSEKLIQIDQYLYCIGCESQNLSGNSKIASALNSILYSFLSNHYSEINVPIWKSMHLFFKLIILFCEAKTIEYFNLCVLLIYLK